ncbi:MAG: ribosome recycling factor [Oscillospiraceae bacterium]|jgi:ribosome recycling factor|nr:ribosome recycling factor [Oscillospiraceae bacterium]
MDSSYLEETESAMKKVIAFLEGEYKALRAGRANPSILEKVFVDYYGAQTPVCQLASISVVESRTLVVQAWDLSILRSVEKAILKADLGVTPQNDGKIIRITFPPLTEERRRELSKEISKISEESKIKIRNVRRDAFEKIKIMKKSTEISNDEALYREKKVQSLTDVYSGKIESLKESKIKDTMEI